MVTNGMVVLVFAKYMKMELFHKLEVMVAQRESNQMELLLSSLNWIMLLKQKQHIPSSSL